MGTAAAHMHDPALQCCCPAAAPAAVLRRLTCALASSPPPAASHTQALKEGQRIDGRTPFELRAARFQFALDDSSCTVLLGRTRVMAVVAATLEAPFADRHNEGTLRFNVEFSPMASPAFEPGAGAGLGSGLWALGQQRSGAGGALRPCVAAAVSQGA